MEINMRGIGCVMPGLTTHTDGGNLYTCPAIKAI